MYPMYPSKFMSESDGTDASDHFEHPGQAVFLGFCASMPPIRAVVYRYTPAWGGVLFRGVVYR